VSGADIFRLTLASRQALNHQLSGVLDETTERCGIKVTQVEVKDIEPAPDVRESGAGSR
jgi:regulator of protease activity HflC (stomatin/prohibitin superfamily)